jgi:hypothetical protein
MQHDTSPHAMVVGGKHVTMQTASLVLGYSRMRFMQHYTRFTRFECKVFLTDALLYLRGRLPALHDRQHARGGAGRYGSRHGGRAGDGGFTQ